MERYLCIHGHFYQPPRQNAWLETIELQDSANPYHDWNERVTAECYAPNAVSRILDGEKRIVAIVNNYAKISFDFGPALLAWMEHEAPESYRAIIEADRRSQEIFSGHGSALAQAYNHMIMPLATRCDKYTQILWGIEDFKHRFGRSPEGMWLPETAVDLESLDIMAESGIRFTMLAPHQAATVRKKGKRAWREVSGGRIDPTRCYELRLPSGRRINLFFYNEAISGAVAFKGLLSNGDVFSERLLSGFNEQDPWPQLVHIATDGETYGHHHRYGDMALAYALHHIESNKLARITNYGEYLEKHPPCWEVNIVENTSWSCAHGIERWQSDCGCNSGGHQEWNQHWRAPLRQALNWLRDTVEPTYEDAAFQFFKDPWLARNEYISVILDRSPERISAFLNQQADRELSDTEKTVALKLLELQRYAMLMFTSCGWFFDEISGIETLQIMQYAGRVIQLAEEVLGSRLEGRFVEFLQAANSNLVAHGNGRQVYEKFVKPAMVDLARVGAHYAVSSLFESYEKHARIYCYQVDREDYHIKQAGRGRVAVGRARVTSSITGDSAVFSFGALHFGDHNLNGGVCEYRNPEAYEALVREVLEAFAQADLPRALRLLDNHFEGATYTLKSLFRDEQRKILNPILELMLAEIETVHRQVYEHHAPLMRFLTSMHIPLPKTFRWATEVTLNNDLRSALEEDDLDLDRIKGLLEEAQTWRIELDTAGLAFACKHTVERTMERLRANPNDLAFLQRSGASVALIRSLPFDVDAWKAQNVFHDLTHAICPFFRRRARSGDENARAWLESFAALGEGLGVRVSEMEANEMELPFGIGTIVQTILDRQHLPCATHRLQFNHDFTFRDAQALIPYFYDLGISHFYASPLLKSRSSSAHGYDICDHSQLNPQLGTQEEFEALCGDLQARGMGLILDTVPNHIGIGEVCNPWWIDVLENGPSSVYAPYFDIDWHPVKPELENKILLPILEDQYGKVLEAGRFRLTYEDGSFFIYYYDTKLPVAPHTYGYILDYQIETLVEALKEQSEHLQELQSILTALNHLPLHTEVTHEKKAERNREKEVIKRRLANLSDNCPYIRAAIDTSVGDFNGRVADSHSFDRLDALLDAQVYRPAFWRVATEEINYRRFFDVNALAAVRVELPEVFQATHQLILRLLAEGKVSGLRVDHPDGLWDPPGYLRQVQESYLLQQIQAEKASNEPDDNLATAVRAWFASKPDQKKDSPFSWPLYVIAEKILCEGELIPRNWPVYGTTGYDFLNAVNGLMVDSRNAKAFDRIYSQFTGTPMSFGDLLNSAKNTIMVISLASEINALSHQLERLAAKNRLCRDFTLNSLTLAIREVIACLPVYRTYITGSSEAVSQRDQTYIKRAVAEAKKRNPRTAEPIFDFIRDTLLLENFDDFHEDDRAGLIDFVMKLQQVTGPVMAKGMEDTAFYVYNRLVSLNEVGGNPVQFGLSVADFHRQNSERQEHWPYSLLATSTHDTKRSEDVRARINVLSEMPGEWRSALSRWSRLNARKKSSVNSELAPDRNDEYLLYQTMLGVWPADSPSPEELNDLRVRLSNYMLKATREAKVHTSWINPSEEYDEAVRKFILRLLAEGLQGSFMKDFQNLQRRIAYYGQFNSLAQVLLKLTSPGVPDTYQGSELWDFSLVDPDNRKPVDFEHRQRLLAELKQRVVQAGQDLTTLVQDLLETSSDGRIKLYVTYRALSFRRSHEQIFSRGRYLPLEAGGEKGDNVCAFLRSLRNNQVLVAVPRMIFSLTGGVEQPPLGSNAWVDTTLLLPSDQMSRGYRNILTGETHEVDGQDGKATLLMADICKHFPLALLECRRS